MISKLKLSFFIFLLFINGCTYSDINKKSIAEIITSSGASYAAYKFSDGDIFTTLIGSATGYLIGGYLGDYLEKNDYYYYKSALLNTLERNQIGLNGYWKNKKSGNEGVVIVKNYYKHPECRLIEHIYLVKSKPSTYFDTACRENSGSWKIIR